MSQLSAEIREQGAALAARAATGFDAAAEAAEHIRGLDYLIVAARGSSDNAARYAQYLLGKHAGLTVGLAAPWLFSGDFDAPSLAGGGVLAVSQSGSSPDVVAVLAEARRQDRPAIAVTGDAGSPLAAAADVVVPLAVGAERSVAATKTFTASLHAIAQLALALRPDPAMAAWLDRVPGLVTETAAAQLESRERFDRLDAASHLTVVGRGMNFSTAHEVALKLRELSGTTAEAFSPPDLLHGPIASLSASTGLWLVSAGGGRQLDPALGDALRAYAGTSVVVSDEDELLGPADIAVRLPAGLPDWVAPFLAVVPGQAAALRLAELRGVDIDAPHGLSKITLTR
ncbi:MAG TPA: SIS domain-containing protein [Thermoleophilaceae bacterium]